MGNPRESETIFKRNKEMQSVFVREIVYCLQAGDGNFKQEKRTRELLPTQRKILGEKHIALQPLPPLFFPEVDQRQLRD